ncbi:SMI1/KNR4 family protein [Stenotrophomonas sp. DR009]|uniref:SMI1/KNR4 family protein n=1 Tax=Stenotrophomonas sp. DR009 TaxID=3398461 RepID=UPI003BAF0E60
MRETKHHAEAPHQPTKKLNQMKKHTQFAHSDVNFNDSLPGIGRDKLEPLLPHDFPGRDYFISFYSNQNGGYFDGGAYIYLEDFHNLNPGDRDLFEIEAFHFFPAFEKQENQRLTSISEVIGFRKIAHNVSSIFLKENIPFAGDAGDNDFWLNTSTGSISYTITNELTHHPSTIFIAPDFRTFCDAIRGSLKPMRGH